MVSRRYAVVTLLLELALLPACRVTSDSKPPSPEPGVEGARPKPHEPPIALPAKDDARTDGAAPPPAVALKRETLPESIAQAPQTDSATPRVAYDTVILPRTREPAHGSSWRYRRTRRNEIVGFEFSNRGGNSILPPRHDIAKNLFFARDYQFRFDDRARQDIHLYVSDWVPSRDRQFRLSGLMNSVFYFFPRNYLPAIFSESDRAVVTLPTGEPVEFDAVTYEVRGGVFTENPVDLNPDRAKRTFPGVHYTGKGVVVRADARGADPRAAKTATITTGTPPPDCPQGNGCGHCQIAAQELWNQSGAFRFKFSTDDAFDQFLRSRCGFGIPKQLPGDGTRTP